MADMMETLKNILGDDAEEKINNAMGAMKNDDTDYVSEIKSLIEQMSSSHSDPRTTLLMSLRPYMRSERQRSIDGAVRLLNLSRLSGLFLK